MTKEFEKLNIAGLEDLNQLDEKSRELALRILKEYSDTGYSEIMNKMVYDDYKEIPVDIETFLHDPTYLGKGLVNQEGKFTVFPYWVNVLKKIFPDNVTTAYRTLVLSGAIGLGKSFVAVLCILYQLYRMLCLKDPYLHYGLQPIDKITFSVMNITLEAAKGVAWDKLQQLVQSSPWFMAHGKVSGRDTLEWQPLPGIELIYGSQPRHVIGRAVFSSFEDEISFQLNQDVEKQKEKATLLISSIDARMQSRYMKGEYLPTLHILASSKRTDQSFLESYIENKKKNESKTTLIIDEPQWVIRTDKDSPNKFYVAVGNKLMDSVVLPLDITPQDLQIYRDKGYTLIQVPIGYREQFVDDIDIALTDIAGISTSNTMRYLSGPRIVDIKDRELKNPFTKEILVVGDGAEDTLQYSDFIDMKNVDQSLMSHPLYVHLDMSISGDKTGIAGVWIKGKKPTKEGQPPSKELYYQLAFSFAVKAPKGHQVSFEKNREFIRWLRRTGFNVAGVSSDTFQSAQIQQQLKAEGFNCSIISVDKVDTESHVCLPYQYLKSTIYDRRVRIYDAQLLTDELVGLERANSGRIDHSSRGVNCFTADTKISLTDGREIRIVDLIEETKQGKTNYVYSFNETLKRIEPKRVTNGWCSGKTSKIAIVTLDNGETIECTPEHKFMLRDGSYCEAQALIPNDSLMPLYRKYPSRGLCNYRMYYDPMQNKWHFEHRQFAVSVYDKKYLVHHIDCNPKNNNPENLVWMSREAHVVAHSKIQTGAQSPEANAKRKASVKMWWSENKNTENDYMRVANRYNRSVEEVAQARVAQEIHKQEKINEINKIFGVDYASLDKPFQIFYMRKYSNYLKGYDVFTDKRTPVIEKRAAAGNYYSCDYDALNEHEKRSMSIKYARVADPTYQERVSRAVSENHKKGKYKNAAAALKKCNEASHNAKLERYHNSKKYQEILEMNKLYGIDYESLPQNIKISYIHRYHNSKKKNITNHKVVSVCIIDKEVDVYDITVEDNHNFALTAGVIVHNSKDIADAFCGALFNASKNAEQFALDFGEDLEEILTHNVDSQKQQVTIQLEEEMKTLLDPVKKAQPAKTKTPFMDFGLGAAQETGFNPYVAQGIMYWGD